MTEIAEKTIEMKRKPDGEGQARASSNVLNQGLKKKRSGNTFLSVYQWLREKLTIVMDVFNDSSDIFIYR